MCSIVKRQIQKMPRTILLYGNAVNDIVCGLCGWSTRIQIIVCRMWILDSCNWIDWKAIDSPRYWETVVANLNLHRNACMHRANSIIGRKLFVFETAFEWISMRHVLFIRTLNHQFVLSGLSMSGAIYYTMQTRIGSYTVYIQLNQ